jgi:hypothetical protein
MDTSFKLDKSNLEENIIFMPLIVEQGINEDIVEKVSVLLEKMYAEKIRLFFINNKGEVASSVKAALKKLRGNFYESEGVTVEMEDAFNSKLILILQEDEASKDLNVKDLSTKFNATFIKISLNLGGVEEEEKGKHTIFVGIKYNSHFLPADELKSVFKYKVYNSKVLLNLIKVVKGEKSIRSLLFNSDQHKLESTFVKIMGKSWPERLEKSSYPASMLITSELAYSMKDDAIDFYDANEYKNLVKDIGLLDMIILNQGAKYFDTFTSSDSSYQRFNVKKLLDPNLEKQQVVVNL